MKTKIQSGLSAAEYMREYRKINRLTNIQINDEEKKMLDKLNSDLFDDKLSYRALINWLLINSPHLQNDKK